MKAETIRMADGTEIAVDKETLERIHHLWRTARMLRRAFAGIAPRPTARLLEGDAPYKEGNRSQRRRKFG